MTGLLERVAASAAGVGAVDGLGADVEELRTRERSIVLAYRFEGGLRLIAKRYARHADAVATYEVLRVLREQGFGAGSSHQVAEPLGCFADWGVVLMRAVPGHCLQELVTRPIPWEEGLRAAGAWLARLHGSSAGLGPRDDMAQAALRLAQRAPRAAAQHPELERLLVRLVEELAERAWSITGPGSMVPSHGRYHAGHVYVAPESVAVIDLDRAALADPAKDVGEFLHFLRAQARRAGLGDDAADEAASAFLEAYAADAGAVPGGVVYYWSYSVLAKLLRVVELGHARWEKRYELYRAEFDAVPKRLGTLTGSAG